jgi:hypothetical protein
MLAGLSQLACVFLEMRVAELATRLHLVSASLLLLVTVVPFH